MTRPQYEALHETKLEDVIFPHIQKDKLFWFPTYGESLSKSVVEGLLQVSSLISDLYQLHSDLCLHKPAQECNPA
eukprot:1291472-Amphidinium_carterae.1